MRSCLRSVVFSLLVCSASLSHADIWDNTFRLQMANSSGAGIENPLVQVGFNPQPEPPAYSPIINLNDPTAMEFLVDDISVANGNMRILFGIAAPFEITATGEQDDGEYEFHIDGSSLRDRFTVQLEMLTSQGGFPNPGSWSAFNPQPEPPALGGGASAIGFDFAFDPLVTSATMQLRILHTSSGIPQSFSFAPVPEPGSIALLGLASAISFVRRRR